MIKVAQYVPLGSDAKNAACLPTPRYSSPELIFLRFRAEDVTIFSNKNINADCEIFFSFFVSLVILRTTNYSTPVTYLNVL